jgi:CBS domain-containing protein
MSSRIDELVARYMSEPVVVVPSGTAVRRVYDVLVQRRLSSVPVVDTEGRGCGVVSRTDLLRIGRLTATALKDDELLELPDLPVDEIMSPGVATVGTGATVADAARLMTERRIHRVYVERDGLLTGAFTTRDVLRALVDARTPRTLSDLMSQPVFTVPVTATLASATDELGRTQVAGLVVLDAAGFAVGVFSQREALLARALPPETHVETVMSPALLFLDRHTPVFRAAAQAHALRPRRVLATDDRAVVGVLSGLDFARAAL